MSNEKAINKHTRFNMNCKLAAIMRSTISLAEMLPEEMIKSCITCETFNESTEVCNKYKMKPPARIIAFGCPDYNNISEDIPF